MKKALGLILLLALGLFAVSGCNQSSSGGSSTPTVPASTVASDLGTMARFSLDMDNQILGVISIAGVAGARAMAPSTPTYANSWWTSTDSYSSSGMTYDKEFNFRVWDTGGSEITTIAGLQGISSSADLSALWTYTSITYTFSGGSYTIKYGTSTGDPLKFTGYNTASPTISGPLSFSSSYQGTSYSVTFTYGNLTMATGGYPNGTISWSMSENSSEVAAGSIAFNGTAVCTITFTSGLSGTYQYNIDTGAIVTSAY
ncbi:MAG: hypothetical protein JW782_04755 [Candidatus Saganbacteria bacterium]|nr:hypothetical protein [Candidatus Saganbacteria bacterium]